ncbi:putative thioesterase [Chitinophaga skermanii]|uniref:Putative thioesterase n=1 Tax=Chitinophaga skermanii TaxID=331697 RepID=A0A327Q6H7_9BACT|nr:hypothetical protein [Chitinophaga skermanii]RAI99407.1 putative thioesterase [Chitinophaga skermanii]
MKHALQIGDSRTFQRLVRPTDCATFDSGAVHPVYATFALSRDAEWCCRLFVLDEKDENEEGIGTMLTVEHRSPALEGTTVDFVATILEINRHEIICSYEARVGERLIAQGKTGQKILLKEKLEKLFQTLS